MEAASISHGAHDASHAGAHGDEQHGPIEANRSSRVDPPTLGMLLFIISEIMIFGAFFTAYFFIRVAQGDPWPAPGNTIPEAVAAFNTAILISSSFTLHWAETSIKAGNRNGLRAGILSTLLLGATFLFVQLNEYVHLGFAPHDSAQATIFYGLTGLHGAHVCIGLILLSFATIRSFRGHYSAHEHTGLNVPGIYWHFVDIMWIVVFTSVYVI